MKYEFNGGKMKIGIRPFRTSDAQEIVRWCSDEEEFYKWSAGILGEYPLTVERFIESTSGRIDDKKYFPFCAFDDDGIFGFFILRHPEKSLAELRVGFVIVSPEKRGKGYGKKMLKLALKYAFEIYGVEKVGLGVFENNESAIKCYESVGFKKYGKMELYDIKNVKWNCFILNIVAEEYEDKYKKENCL